MVLFVLICIESTTILKESRFAQLSSENEWTLVQIYMVEWMGHYFDVFRGFQKIPC